MQDFVYHVPGRVLVGTDSLSRLGSEAQEFGRRIVILTESVVREAGIVDRVRSQLERVGKTVLVFDELDVGSDSKSAEQALGVAKASHTELVIGLGGMRVLAAARLVAAFTGKASTVREASALGGQVKPLPYIEIPSSCRNHLMLKNYCVVTDAAHRQPLTVRLPPGLMTLAIIDAKLAAGLTARSYAAVLIDSILASVEGIISTKSNTLSDTLLMNSVATLREATEQVIAAPDDIRPRARAAEASFMSALGLSMSSQGVGGAVAYGVNSHFDVPKSWVGTVLLPYILDYFEGVRPEKLRRIASALGAAETGDDAARKSNRASAAARRLLARTGLPARLRELDLTLDDLSRVADAASDFEMIGFLPIPVSTQELYDILKQAW